MTSEYPARLGLSALPWPHRADSRQAFLEAEIAITKDSTACIIAALRELARLRAEGWIAATGGPGQVNKALLFPGTVRSSQVPSVAMDEQAFQPGTPEDLLHDQATVLMSGGALKNKRGHAHLTNDRVLFMDQRFNPTQAGAVGGLLAGADSNW